MAMLQELVRRTISPEFAKIAAVATLGVAVAACGIDSLLPFFRGDQAAVRSATDSWFANINFAYFAALLVHWCLVIRSGEPAWVSVAIARCGAAISVLCFCIALATGHLSVAIAIAYLCNAAFVILLEGINRERLFQLSSVIAPLCVFATVLVAFYVARNEQERIRVEQIAKEEFQRKRESTEGQVKDSGESTLSKSEQGIGDKASSAVEASNVTTDMQKKLTPRIELDREKPPRGSSSMLTMKMKVAASTFQFWSS